MSVTSMFEISRNLVASTAHITMEDRDLLEAAGEGESPLVVYSFEYGFLIYIPTDPAKVAEEGAAALARGYSQALVDLLALTSKEGCRYLLLDQDGPIYDNLPAFMW
jgi:hypothetical protein